MSLPVKLSPFLLSELYPHVLYDFSKDESKPGSVFAGKNLKHISVYLYETGFPIISDSDLDFLKKILQACKLTIDDTLLINTAQPEINPAALCKTLSPKHVILFGVALEKLELPMIFPEYQVQPFAGCTYLSAPPLQTISNNNEEKKKLWQSLKRMFEIE